MQGRGQLSPKPKHASSCLPTPALFQLRVLSPEKIASPRGNACARDRVLWDRDLLPYRSTRYVEDGICILRLLGKRLDGIMGR